MRSILEPFRCLVLAALLPAAAGAQESPALAGTQPLAWTGDLSARMVTGIDTFLMRELEKSVSERAGLWRRDFASREAYEKSVSANREHLRRIIGAVDARLPVSMEVISEVSGSPAQAQAGDYSAAFVRWPVFEGVYGEGLLLRPKAAPGALVVAVPDADQTPEMVAGLQPGLGLEGQFARRLAENGCAVIIPVLVDRRDTYSGNPRLNRFTNQPHREWIYRQAFEMGRHVIGYEVQKVLAAVDWLEKQYRGPNAPPGAPGLGVMGQGEGGLIALYSAALDPRLDSALVSGYFDSRQRLWEEPIYRNVFGLLKEFGDAEIATLIVPRRLVVEYSDSPRVDGPPPPREGRRGAAPGRLASADFLSVEREVQRARDLIRDPKEKPVIEFVYGSEGMLVSPGSERSLVSFLQGLGLKLRQLGPSRPVPDLALPPAQAEARQQRQVNELVQFTQRLFRESERVRDRRVWDQLKPPGGEAWTAVCQSNRTRFWEEVIGRLPKADRPLNPRTRKIQDKPKWTGYEVVLDVWPDVFAWGYLLVPNDLAPGERRPVVVCQHGLEGLPEDVVTDDPKSGGFAAYQAYAARLAERGFVVFAPHNPYRGGDRFRVLQRKANPLGKSLFSVIIAQHDALLDWLGALAVCRSGPDRLLRPELRRQDGHAGAGGAGPLLPLHLLGRFQRVGAEEPDRGFGLFLPLHGRVRDVRMGPGPHLQLRGDGLADCAPPLHGRARPFRWRGPGSLGGLRICEGAPDVCPARAAGPHRDRVLQRPAPDPRSGDLPFPGKTPAMDSAWFQRGDAAPLRQVLHEP